MKIKAFDNTIIHTKKLNNVNGLREKQFVALEKR